MNYSNGGKSRGDVVSRPHAAMNRCTPGKDGFVQKVLRVIKKIPHGKVLTYGQVATLVGTPRAARIVGGILFQQGPMSRVPWQRVINSKGGISTYRVGFGDKQKELLEKEGIVFNVQGYMDLKKHQWWPSRKFLADLALDDELVESISKKFGF